MAKITKFFTNPKNWLPFFFIVLIICSLIIYPFINPIKEYEIYSYPEEEYIILENEITRIVESKVFVSEYEFMLHNNIEEDICVIEMKTEKASVAAEIINYGKDTESVSIKRTVPNVEEHEKKQKDLIVWVKYGKILNALLCSWFIAVILLIIFVTISNRYKRYCLNKSENNIEEEN